jgi:PAS domain S-box-containing protein
MSEWPGTIGEVTHGALLAVDAEGRVLAWNDRAEAMFAIPRMEAIGRSFASLVLPERYHAEFSAGLRRCAEGGEWELLERRVELDALRPDGSEFPIEMTISRVADASGYAYHAVIGERGEPDAAARQHERLLQELREALSGSEQRLAVTLDALAEAVTIRGEGDRLMYANRAALDRMGVDSVAALREADPRELLEPYRITSEDGREIRVEDLPSARLLRGEDPEPLLMRTVHRASGEEHWVLLKATPVPGPQGKIESAVTIIEDVTAEHRAAVRTQFLARAGEVLASSLEYGQTLRNVAGLAVPRIADWCAVDLLDEHGGREPVAIAHSDPTRIEMAERLREFEGELDPTQGLGRVMRTGASELYSEIPDELLAAAARSPEHLELLRAVGMRSVLIVPLRVAGRTIGALTLVQSESGRSFDEDDMAFAEQIAARAALAVEHARLYSERSEMAHTLQRSLLPDALPSVPGWEVAALYRPAGENSEVGGDFYDIWEVGDDWLVLIGDVTGKGVGAATLTSLARHTANTASEFDARPARVLARIDAALQRRPPLALCTALCLRLRGDVVTVTSAGHPLPLRLSPGGRVTEVGRHGLLLGAQTGVWRGEDAVQMRPGESLVVLTDGVTDAVGAGRERYGVERLRGCLQEIRDEPPLVVLQRIIDSLESFQVGPQADDTAILVARYTGVVQERDGERQSPAPAVVGAGGS